MRDKNFTEREEIGSCYTKKHGILPNGKILRNVKIDLAQLKFLCYSDDVNRQNRRNNMTLCEQFINSNGRVYEVLRAREFNAKDKEYFKNSWQKKRVALMHIPHSEEFVVAQYVGETSWGYGSYFNTLESAEHKYDEVVKSYLG